MNVCKGKPERISNVYSDDLWNMILMLLQTDVKKRCDCDKYLNSNNITVKVMVNYNNDIILKKGDIIKISNECCRIIDDFGFNFYLKQNGEDINWETYFISIC